MSIDDVIDLSITANTLQPSRASFGVPMIMAVHARTANIFDLFSSPKEMTDVGFLVTDPAYLIAQKVFSQNPRPSKVAIGKRTRKFTKTVNLLPQNTTEGFTYKFTVVDYLGVATDISYTVLAGATVATICTAIAALLGSIAHVVVTATSTTVHFVATQGELFNLKNLPKPVNCKVADVTADPGVASDLSDIVAVNATDWYGILLDSESKAEVVALASPVEALRKIFGYSTSDSACFDGSSTTDVMYTLKAAAYARTFGNYISNELLNYSAAAEMGAMLPTDPGKATWAFKRLAAVTVDSITGGQESAIEAKFGNVYITMGGLPVTMKGTMAGGTFIDITVFLDFLHARIQEAIFGTMANLPKIPYTDSGTDIIRGQIMSVLKQAQGTPQDPGGLSLEVDPVVTIPKVKDVSVIDRANRFLPNIVFTGQLSGAVQSMKIGGTVSV